MQDNGSFPAATTGVAPPASVATLFQQAVALHQKGELAPAEKLYREILDQAPGHADALHLLGVVHQQRGQNETAAELIAQSIAINAGRPGPHSNLGIALHRLGRFDQALASFDQALMRKPDHVEALINRGNTLRELRRPEQALASYRQALALRGEFPEGLLNCGNALQDLRRFDEALACYDRALALRPGYADAHVYRGNALRDLRHQAQALASYDRALELNPAHVGAWLGRGNALNNLRRHGDALAAYARVQELRPDLPEVLNNRGAALRDLKRYSEAAEAFARLAALRPDFDYVLSNQLHSQLYCCDWSSYDESVQRISAQVASGARGDVPFSFLAISDSAEAQLQCARSYAAEKFPAVTPPLWAGQTYSHERIHLAYLSADFHAHATAYLMAGLFERHDRKRFRLTAISFGPDTDDDMRRRLRPLFDDFVDVRNTSDRDAATLLREGEVDIAIDLKGFTTGNRCAILAHRPAPVQVSYLGYPGTMGAPYIDYLIADQRIVPPAHRRFYQEAIASLPDSYQVNDAARVISTRRWSRVEAGLPAQGFVFCCFNNNYKIMPAVFYCWMRLLKQVPGSVLWLLADNADAVRNLRSEANRKGIAPERLVFAERVPADEHLARHRLADLFLDTRPCNAHTTASDALWAGLPVLTCMGSAFAGRVAGSLLAALGLGELITTDLARYEAVALRLATSPASLAQIHERLETNRLPSPLFDTDRFRRHLESAYEMMLRRHAAGMPPASFDVS